MRLSMVPVRVLAMALVKDSHGVLMPGANWWKGGWDPKFNAELRQFTEINGDFGISKEMTPSRVPGAFGDFGGSFFSEITGKGIEKRADSMGREKMINVLFFYLLCGGGDSHGRTGLCVLTYC
ncbi:hypothetical protein LNP17_04210 [Klebsiella variicola subsp. variicola]|nr:hypothetical protein [Klebsiella variicola subsp. variicola]